MKSLRERGGQEVGGEIEAAFRARTGRGTALEAEIAMSEKLGKGANSTLTCAQRSRSQGPRREQDYVISRSPESSAWQQPRSQ